MLVAADAGPKLAESSSTRPLGTGPMAAMIGILHSFLKFHSIHSFVLKGIEGWKASRQAHNPARLCKRVDTQRAILMGGISTAIC